MLKRSKAIVLSLGFFAGHPSFAQPKPADPVKKDEIAHFREYQPEDKSFTLLYPSSWKVVSGQKPPNVAMFANPDSVKPGTVTESITLAIVSTQGANFDRFCDAAKAQMAAKEGLTLIEDANFTVGTWKTHRFVFDVKSNGLTIRAIKFIMIKDQSAYVLTFYMSPEKYTKEAEDRAFQLCGTFKLGGDQPTTTTTDGPTAFESKEFGFRLSYPPTWTKQALDQQGLALAISRRASAGKVPQILMVMADTLDADEKVDLKEMETKLIESTKASLKDGKVIESADCKLGGEPARRVILGGTRVADDHQGRAILTFCIRGRSTFGLVAGSPIEDFDKVKADVDKIVASFAFAGGTDVKPPTQTQAKPPAATDTKTQAGPTLVDSPALGLKLTYPANWTARKSSDPTIPLMLLSTPTRPTARPNTIMLTTEPVTPGTRASLKEQSDGALAGLKASIPDAKVIESADVKVGNEKGRRMVVGGHTAAKIEVRSIFLLFQHGSNALTLSGQAPAEEFATLKEAFDELASSIKLAVPAPKK